MKVCCDEEDQPELVEALSERLSVKVAALSEDDRESGDILIEFSEQLSEQAVNLYPDSLKPKKENFTLTNVVFAWGAVAAILLTSFAYLHFQQSSLNQELEDFQIQQREFEQQLASLNERLAKHKPSAAKVAAVARLKLDIQAKRASLKAVDEFDDSQQIGYSGVMLSLIHI